MNIVMPAAGNGQRFKDAGYTVPKPLIPVDGMPMISRVLTSFIKDFTQHLVVAVVQQGFPKIYGVQNVYLDHVTDGAARSVILGIHGAQLPLNDPLLIVNSDQIVDFDFDDFILLASASPGSSGSVVVFPAVGNRKWSYARIDDGQITFIAEKEPISEWATAGFYYWSRTSDFLDAAQRMIKGNCRVNGEFYVAPVYNHIDPLRSLPVVTPYAVPASAHHSLGTPEDLQEYLASKVEA